MECGDVGNWNPPVLKKILSIIPVSDRLEKTLLVRTLQDYLHRVSVAEPILELLEELLCRDASPPPVIAAYCAVAVECSVKYLLLDPGHTNPRYLSAVNRIWRGRVQRGEGSLIFLDELESWRSVIEASLEDSQVRETLASMDTRRDAISKPKACLAEACHYLGLSFLELEAANHLGAQHLEIQKCRAAAAEDVHPSTTIGVQMVGEDISLELQMLAKELNSLDMNEEAQYHDRGVPEADMMEGAASSSHLPTPEGTKHSPLKTYEFLVIKRRRQRKKWTDLEEKRSVVDKYGIGNWKPILDAYRDIFEGRTVVDLKDKWRNIMKRDNKLSEN